MKRTNRKTKRTRGALSTRGGFTVPFGTSTRKYMKSAATRIVKENALRSGDPSRFVRSSLSKLEQAKLVVDIAGTGYAAMKDAGVFGKERSTVGSESNSMSTTMLASGNIGRRFMTKFHVGDEPSRSVRLAEQVGGSRKLTFYDTDVSLTNPAERSDLSPSTGFNQKLAFGFNEIGYWSYRDLFELSGVDVGWIRSMTKSQRTYWMTKYFGVEYRMYNKNKYLPMKLKVHMCKQEIMTESPKAKFNQTFFSGAALPAPADLTEGTIPYNEQLTLLGITPRLTAVGIDPIIGSLYHSAAFKQNFDVVRTFTKTLEPGEVWNFDYKHSTGSGINIQSLAEKEESGSGATGYNENAAAFYYPVFELLGPKVECFQSTNSSNAYIGTGAGSVLFEMRKYAEITEDTRDVLDFAGSVAQGGGASASNWAFKTYTDRGTSTSDTTVDRRFNVSAPSILKAGETPAAEKYIIPVSTDFNVKRAGYDNPG